MASASFLPCTCTSTGPSYQASFRQHLCSDMASAVAPPLPQPARPAPKRTRRKVEAALPTPANEDRVDAGPCANERLGRVHRSPPARGGRLPLPRAVRTSLPVHCGRLLAPASSLSVQTLSFAEGAVKRIQSVSPLERRKLRPVHCGRLLAPASSLSVQMLSSAGGATKRTQSVFPLGRRRPPRNPA